MGKKRKGKVPGTYESDRSILRVGEGDFDEEGHVIVVTQFGLAMLVAGLRSILDESPEVAGLLSTLEEALAEGMQDRMKDAVETPRTDVVLPWEA